MKGDFSRSTFDPQKHYRGVRMQQGRVQLDADWNENLDILLHRIETESIDVIGECGIPVHHAAFGVVAKFADLTEDQTWLTDHGWASLDPGDFYLTGGRAYVDGTLLEVEHTLPFSQQPFVLPKGGGKITSVGIYLLYLDVWNRHMTALEDPSIREVALGGPDTTTRMQVIWQAVLAQVGDVGKGINCADDLHPWPDKSTGQLQARTTSVPPSKDPCTVPPGSGYTRLENQLYRVEIHKGSGITGGPTFKWSRDNGSVVVAVSEFPVDGSNAKVRTSSLGRDDVLGLHENDWVEVLDESTELAGMPGMLVKITLIEPGNILTLSQNLSGFSVNDSAGNPTHLKVRRWDVNATQTQAEVVLTEGIYIPLEGGVEVQFKPGGTYRTGDYWLIPARTVPGQYGDIEWPQDGSDPAALLAFGIEHHYCKLALVTAVSSGSGISISNVDDCRKKFPPLTELPAGGNCCCTVSVGQGGDYPDIQSALDAWPKEADVWHICVMAGVYQLADTVTADNVAGLTISGCGQQTHIIGPQAKPVFSFTGGQDVQLDNLWIRASSPEGAILFTQGGGIVVSNCTVVNRILGDQAKMLDTGAPVVDYAKIESSLGNPGPGIVVIKGKEVEIRDNTVSGLPAVQTDGQELFILHNRLTSGGIQIVPPSNNVQIEDNMVFKGTGPGIQLGGDQNDASAFIGYKDTMEGVQVQNILAGIKITTISRNLIGMMDGSGIVTELSLVKLNKLGDVEILTISGNQIIACASQPDVILSETSQVGGGIALIGVFSAQINDNLIAGNGAGSSPACGIFVLDGSDIDMNDNTVIENGVDKLDTDPVAYQAGIAAQFVYGNFLGLGKTEAGMVGYPALRVCGNQVICPSGQALTIAAMGSLVIEGNTLVTREKLKQPTTPLDFGEKGASVFVLDMGLPIWLPDFALVMMGIASGQTSLHLEDAQVFDEVLARLPDGRVLFHDNQVTFHTDQVEPIVSLGDMGSSQWILQAWNAATFSAMFTSFDDISLNGNQFQASVPLYVLQAYQDYKGKATLKDYWAYLLKFIHVGSVATTIRATGNGLTERLLSNGVSYASNASAMNVTTSNEATHTFVTNAPKKAETDNLVLTS